MLEIACLQVPDAIRKKLSQLSESIDFHEYASKGANGEVFFGQNRVHGRRVAVKFYYWAGDHAYHAEPRNLAALNSTNVTSVLDAAFVGDEWAYFLMPYFENGDLEDKINGGPKGNRWAIDLARDVLNGLSHLHAGRMVHRDLKPQNIFMSDDGSAIIGDFGSVKRIPDGLNSVPGSGHSLIYRPPESIDSNEYSTRGDFYQVGILLYQLLGGSLPNNEQEWLSPRQLQHYNKLTDHADRSIYATLMIKEIIKKGRVLKIDTLPEWVCSELRRTVSKACHVNPTKRFQSCAHFLGHIGRIRRLIHDWSVVEGHPTRRNGASYRIILRPSGYQVQKCRGSGWRNDNSLVGTDLSELVRAIDARCI